MNRHLLINVMLICSLLTACATKPPVVRKVGDNDYNINGKFDKEKYDKIIEIVKDNPNRTLNFYVSSWGGTSDDLFEAMDAVYAHGRVHWYSLDHCDSACAVMALSTKHAHGNFRLHSFYKHNHHHVEASPDFNEKVLNKLGSYGYNQAKLRHMFNSVEKLCPFFMDETLIIEEE